MGEENKVRLHGTRSSPYSFRVELTLKVKGIPYEFVEEDLKNKSALLIQYNPVYKKIPVLVHHGRPIVESLVILEYIDEVWKNNGPQLLPQDPYEKAKVRFWASFLDQQLFATTRQVIITQGEAQEKAIKEAAEALKQVEEGMVEFFPAAATTAALSIGNQNLGLLDILMCPALGTYKALEEVTGVKLIDPEVNPLVFSWVEALAGIPEVKEIKPPHEKIVGFMQMVRETFKA